MNDTPTLSKKTMLVVEDGEIVETGEDDGTIGKKYKCAA